MEKILCSLLLLVAVVEGNVIERFLTDIFYFLFIPPKEFLNLKLNNHSNKVEIETKNKYRIEYIGISHYVIHLIMGRKKNSKINIPLCYPSFRTEHVPSHKFNVHCIPCKTFFFLARGLCK